MILVLTDSHAGDPLGTGSREERTDLLTHTRSSLPPPPTQLASGLAGGFSGDLWRPPDWLGRACGACPPLIGWRKRSPPLLGAELRAKMTKAPPTSPAKNTCVMATGLVREGGVVVVDVVVVVAVVGGEEAKMGIVVVVGGGKILTIK